MKHNRLPIVKPAVGRAADIATTVYRLHDGCATIGPCGTPFATPKSWLGCLHTRTGFRGGYVTDVHVSKRRLFDEESGCDVLAGTTVTTVIALPRSRGSHGWPG
ncbi:MAG: hypothetical protein KatS3mg082_1607 [Nitrospiraceae bacterium]|nr:MAG: hypothetical protein KatS3mg082_1607 [Nitrospiraceae bacterium]